MEETIEQLKAFTELEPLPASFGLKEPVYAAYLNHDHVSAFVDLLLSIAASVRLDVSMQAEAGEDWEAAAVINKHKDELPVLLSHLLPQPSVVRYSFTTTTTGPTPMAPTERRSPRTKPGPTSLPSSSYGRSPPGRPKEKAPDFQGSLHVGRGAGI